MQSGLISSVVSGLWVWVATGVWEKGGCKGANRGKPGGEEGSGKGDLLLFGNICLLPYMHVQCNVKSDPVVQSMGLMKTL